RAQVDSVRRVVFRVLPFEIDRDVLHLGGGLLRRYSRLQSAYDGDATVFSALLFQPFGNRQVERHKDIGREVELEIRREHADDCEQPVAQGQLLVDDFRIRSEESLPQAMTDDYNRVGSGAILFGREGSTELRLHAEGREKVG